MKCVHQNKCHNLGMYGLGQNYDCTRRARWMEKGKLYCGTHKSIGAPKFPQEKTP